MVDFSSESRFESHVTFRHEEWTLSPIHDGESLKAASKTYYCLNICLTGVPLLENT